MIEIKEKLNSGFCKVYQNENFKAAYITRSDAYSYGRINEMKRHNNTDELFVLLAGAATMLILEDEKFVETQLKKDITYVVEKGTWHYLAVSADAKVFVCENADTNAENTDTKSVSYILNQD